MHSSIFVTYFSVLIERSSVLLSGAGTDGVKVVISQGQIV